MELQQFVLRRLMLVCLLAFAQCTFALAASSSEQETSEQLFEKAIRLSDIQSEGSSPFRLKATIRLDEGGKSLQGTYALSWISGHEWREEIKLPSYERIRIGGVDKYWQQRTTSYELAPVFQITQALDFVPLLQSAANDASGKTKKEKHGGAEMICSTRRPVNLAPQEFCFATASGVLELEKFPNGQANGQTEVSAREYSDFRSYGQKLFPHTIRVLRGSKALIMITVNELSPISEAESGQFTPPSDAQVWEFCRSSSRANILSSVPPLYPENARSRHVTGIVRTYAVVDTDGLLRDLKVLNSPDPDLAAAALESLRKRKYQPANCHGQPVREEILQDVIFTIG